MNYDNAIQVLKSGDYIFSIGQFDKQTLVRLNDASKRGEICKATAMWPYVSSGYIKKTIYCGKGGA